eukprot:scaffold164758_cov46-Prasinocladus_malaysianus.AAC.1
MPLATVHHHRDCHSNAFIRSPAQGNETGLCPEIRTVPVRVPVRGITVNNPARLSHTTDGTTDLVSPPSYGTAVERRRTVCYEYVYSYTHLCSLLSGSRGLAHPYKSSAARTFLDLRRCVWRRSAC